LYDPSHTLILVAVGQEAGGILGEIRSPRRETVGRREAVSGFLGEVPVRVLITGPGQVNCVQALTAAVERRRPHLVVQTGCAGGFAQAGLRTGDLGIATCEIDAHLGIETDKADAPLAALPFPVGRYGGTPVWNRYPTDSALSRRVREILKGAFSGEDIAVVSGPFLTVSTITATDRRASWYYDIHRSCMESMEGAGAAHVALHYGLPFIEVRSASNLTGKRDRSRWDLPLACERSTRAMLTLFQEGRVACESP